MSCFAQTECSSGCLGKFDIVESRGFLWLLSTKVCWLYGGEGGGGGGGGCGGCGDNGQV